MVPVIAENELGLCGALPTLCECESRKLSENIDDGETVRLDGLQNKQATFFLVRCEHGTRCFMMVAFTETLP